MGGSCLPDRLAFHCANSAFPVFIFHSDPRGRRADDDIIPNANLNTFRAFARKYALVITRGCELHEGPSNYGNVRLCRERTVWPLSDFLLLPTERCLEDHEHVVQVQASMTSESKFVFRKNYAKYEFFKNPLVSLSPVQSHCRHLTVCLFWGEICIMCMCIRSVMQWILRSSSCSQYRYLYSDLDLFWLKEYSFLFCFLSKYELCHYLSENTGKDGENGSIVGEVRLRRFLKLIPPVCRLIESMTLISFNNMEILQV